MSDQTSWHRDEEAELSRGGVVDAQPGAVESRGPGRPNSEDRKGWDDDVERSDPNDNAETDGC